MTFVFTVIAGVMIFVAEQIFLKLVIEPTLELKKALCDVSKMLLIHQARLTNATPDNNIASAITSDSAELLSKSDVVLGYKLAQKIFKLPSKSDIRKASIELNGISYRMREESKAFEDSPNYNAKKTNFATENTKAIKEIGELLKLQTTYENS